MPRKLRMYVPGISAHVVQRGNNRSACFFADEDYRFYLQCLERGLERYAVKLHAYVLMKNHVHLLMTPVDETGISRVMQHVGRHYVRHINKTHGRTGTLWEGRHKASLVQAERHLLSCHGYVEMNPVRSGIAVEPANYFWSSYGWHAFGKTDRLISDHVVYERLGADAVKRQLAYRALCSEKIYEPDLHAIRECMAYNYPLGDERFVSEIEAALGRYIGERRPGRPARVEDGEPGITLQRLSRT